MHAKKGRILMLSILSLMILGFIMFFLLHQNFHIHTLFTDSNSKILSPVNKKNCTEYITSLNSTLLGCNVNERTPIKSPVNGEIDGLLYGRDSLGIQIVKMNGDSMLIFVSSNNGEFICQKNEIVKKGQIIGYTGRDNFGLLSLKGVGITMQKADGSQISLSLSDFK